MAESSSSSAGDAPRVSLIVPTYRREDLLVDTLRCALAQDWSPLEVIVVDQTPAHIEPTREYLERIAGRIVYLYQERPSITAARNRGLAASSGELIVFVDDDTRFGPHFIRHHVAAHRAGYDVVQGRVIEADDPLRDDAHPQWMTWYLKVKGTNNCTAGGPVNTLTGCNMSFSRRVYETVGLFDEHYTGLAVREDADYGMRCCRAGFRMGFWPAASVDHLRSEHGGVGSVDASIFFKESYYRNEMYFCRKFFGRHIQWYYRLRLSLRGHKALRRLIRAATGQLNR